MSGRIWGPKIDVAALRLLSSRWREPARRCWRDRARATARANNPTPSSGRPPPAYLPRSAGGHLRAGATPAGRLPPSHPPSAPPTNPCRRRRGPPSRLAAAIVGLHLLVGHGGARDGGDDRCPGCQPPPPPPPPPRPFYAYPPSSSRPSLHICGRPATGRRGRPSPARVPRLTGPASTPSAASSCRL